MVCTAVTAAPCSIAAPGSSQRVSSIQCMCMAAPPHVTTHCWTCHGSYQAAPAAACPQSPGSSTQPASKPHSAGARCQQPTLASLLPVRRPLATASTSRCCSSACLQPPASSFPPHSSRSGRSAASLQAGAAAVAGLWSVLCRATCLVWFRRDGMSCSVMHACQEMQRGSAGRGGKSEQVACNGMAAGTADEANQLSGLSSCTGEQLCSLHQLTAWPSTGAVWPDAAAVPPSPLANATQTDIQPPMQHSPARSQRPPAHLH